LVAAATLFDPAPPAPVVAVTVGVAVAVGVLVGFTAPPALPSGVLVEVGLASAGGCEIGVSVAVGSATGGSVATGSSVAAGGSVATGGSVASAPPAAPERGAGAHAASIRDNTIATDINFKSVECIFACISPLFT